MILCLVSSEEAGDLAIQASNQSSYDDDDESIHQRSGSNNVSITPACRQTILGRVGIFSNSCMY